MQSKINSFFKLPPSPSSSSPPKCNPEDPPSILDDGLAVWEKSQHQFVNTYTRRHPKSNHGDQRSQTDEERESEMVEKPISKYVRTKSEVLTSAKVLNKKRSYAQFHLDLGQSDFNLRTCSTCGVNYAPGDEGDEKEHKIFHRNYTHGIQFKVLLSERVIHTPCSLAGRIVLVLDGDPPAIRNKAWEVIKMMEIELGDGWIFHKLCKVYLFVSSQRVVGCLVAEPIKEAFKVLPSSVDEKSNSATRTRSRSNSKTLRFGEIVLKRETMKKVPAVNSIDALDGHCNGAIVCQEEAVPAICGIRAIWVTPSNRRKHIASQLLDAVRRSFCIGVALQQSQLAFSPPTSAGKALASSYAGAASFLVYKPRNGDK